jgi:LysM repeat protein
MNAIGFVVWGIRNGFKNNWLASNVDANVYEHLTDDMRQICNSTVDAFFSVDKILDYTLLTIFNPNTKDHVQRKAYIALSIVVPNGCFLKGDVIGALQAMMQTYVTKQGNAVVNMVSADDIKAHLHHLQISPNLDSVPHARSKTGLFSYRDVSEIRAHFQEPSIYGFKKVFFISGHNVALEKMQGIQEVHTFSKPLFLTLSDFDPKYFSVNINNQSITSTKSPIKTGDLIQFVERKTKRGKQLQVGSSDVRISMLEIFPPIYERPKPQCGNGKVKRIVAASLLFGLVAVAIYFLLPPPPIPPKPMVGDGSVASTNSIVAVYDFENLRLSNLPQVADSTWFAISHVSSEPVLIDSVVNNNPVLATDKLRVKVDTLITVTYSIKDSLISVRVPVQFKTPAVYKIKSSDNVSNIGLRFNIEKDSLMRWNNITDENKIKEGQELKLVPETATRIPQARSETPVSDPAKVEGNRATGEPKQPARRSSASETTPKNETTEIMRLRETADKLLEELEDSPKIQEYQNKKKGCNDDKDCWERLNNELSIEKKKL